MSDPITKLDLRDTAPCHRCGERPEAYRCKLGVTIYHICGVAISMAANYPTEREAVQKWNGMQEPNP